MTSERQNYITKLSSEFSILDYSSNGHFIINEEFIVLYWNRIIENWSKINRTQILGSSILTHFPHLKIVKYFERIKGVFKSGVPVVFSSQLHSHIIPCPLPGNKTRVHQTFVSRLPLQNSGDRYAFFSIQDETHLSAVIKNNQHTLQQLEAEIEERKRIAEQLEKACQEADNANRTKSDFLANMSHEIRTPMNAVIGLSHLAMQTELTVKQKNYLKGIQSSTNALLGIINDILDFSKIETGQLEVEKIPFQLDDVFSNLANIASINAENKDIEVLFSISRDTPTWLQGDPLRLGQILINLTNNAVKFTEKGEILISSCVIEEDEQQVLLRFSIKDTGIGMTLEQQSKLFQPFSQADTSTTRKFGGTGLGLSISKQLVELQGGEIGVSSATGRGSEFYFTLPFNKQKALDEEQLSECEIQDLHILVVDDSPAARIVMIDMLNNMGADVSSACSGQEAIASIESRILNGETPYDLVLMDWKMPEMDGVETTRKIKDITPLPAIPTIIMATAYGADHVHQKAEKNLFGGFLMKPITQQILAETIKQALSKSTGDSGVLLYKGESVSFGLQGKRILLTEDNLTNQQIASEILESAGILVEIAENGVQAVRRVQNTARPFDAILMDVMMPEMDGLEATRRIRTDFTEEELPIIAMTASVMQHDIDACFDSGMNDVVAKPVDVKKMFATLKKWIPLSDDDTCAESYIKPVTDEPSDILLEKLSGIDVDGALQRLVGNKQLLLKLLLQFYSSGSDMAAKIRRALDEEKWQDAQLFTHDIKGVAGNIGIIPLHIEAQKLELALKNGQTTDLDPLFEKVQREVNAAISNLEALNKEEVESQPPGKRTGDIDPEILASHLVELEKMLNSNNMAANQCFENLQQLLAGGDVDPILSDIESKLGKLDFKGARQPLVSLAEKLGVPLSPD